MVRRRLDRMCSRRAEAEFALWEFDLYERLTQREAELLHTS